MDRSVAAKRKELRVEGAHRIDKLIVRKWLPHGRSREYPFPIRVELRDNRGDRSVALPAAGDLE